MFGLWKGREYQLFDVCPKHITCEMKTLQGQVYIQRWFQDEEGAKLLKIQRFSCDQKWLWACTCLLVSDYHLFIRVS